MSATAKPQILSTSGEPAREVAKLFPPQGQWDESDFFRIHSNQMAELVDGSLEILPMLTWLHQLLVRYFCNQLDAYVEPRFGGTVLCAPLPIRLFPGTVREPDILYFLPQNTPADPNGYPDRVDLVMEIVSEGEAARHRDYVAKRADYLKAGVAEYWIVDPALEVITLLVLENCAYSETKYRPGDRVVSQLLAGFSIDVSTVFELGKNCAREQQTD